MSYSPERAAGTSRYLAATDTESSGTFQISGLPSGDYYVIALTEIDQAKRATLCGCNSGGRKPRDSRFGLKARSP